MSVARWLQCEQAISEYGFLAKHPTTGAACASPYVQMSQQYMRQINSVWYQIFQVVKENCSEEFMGTPQDDMMELLLRKRKMSIVATSINGGYVKAKKLGGFRRESRYIHKYCYYAWLYVITY